MLWKYIFPVKISQRRAQDKLPLHLLRTHLHHSPASTNFTSSVRLRVFKGLLSSDRYSSPRRTVEAEWPFSPATRITKRFRWHATYFPNYPTLQTIQIFMSTDSIKVCLERMWEDNTNLRFVGWFNLWKTKKFIKTRTPAVSLQKHHLNRTHRSRTPCGPLSNYSSDKTMTDNIDRHVR